MAFATTLFVEVKSEVFAAESVFLKFALAPRQWMDTAAPGQVVADKVFAANLKATNGRDDHLLGCGVRLCGRTVCFHEYTYGNLADGVLRCLGAWNHWVLIFRNDVAFGFLVGFSMRYTAEVDFQGTLVLSRSSSGTSFLTSVSLCPFLVERGVLL